jgi:hypothetical protein
VKNHTCFWATHGAAILVQDFRQSRSREAAGRRNWPEAVPKKMRGGKRLVQRSLIIGAEKKCTSAVSVLVARN